MSTTAPITWKIASTTKLKRSRGDTPHYKRVTHTSERENEFNLCPEVGVRIANIFLAWETEQRKGINGRKRQIENRIMIVHDPELSYIPILFNVSNILI